jgi:hypothetical protein
VEIASEDLIGSYRRALGVEGRGEEGRGGERGEEEGVISRDEGCEVTQVRGYVSTSLYM